MKKDKSKSNMGAGLSKELLLFVMACVARNAAGQPIVMNTDGDMEPPNAATIGEVLRYARMLRQKAKLLEAWVRDARALPR